ncbi:hypothetical protein [Anaerosporobacter faecicola]|uniref:hypothetical protein n=1 Tax=Anaerosporobacter faecicola TaxID=2718714 RepID=UPI00143BC3FA|nr:hypothetical protein [Anaerosporobacter faecicola]
MSDDKEVKNALSKLLKEEGEFVKELTEVATKAAGFHARLESIAKALQSDSSTYSSKETDQLEQAAKEKYSKELEDRMKEHATKQLDS